MCIAVLPGKNKGSLLLTLVCWVPLFALSQFAEKEFVKYNTSNGISNNNITAIAQDRFGYIWIGTEHGLNRFDGLNFRQYHSEKNKESLPSDEVLKLKWIDSNNLAVITRYGLNVFNIQSMIQQNLVVPAGVLKHLDRVNTTRDLLTDSTGNYYITTRSGFYHFNSKMELVFRYDDYSPEHAEAKAMGFGTFLGWLDKNNIVVTGQMGAYHYNTISKTLIKINGRHPDFLVFGEMNKMGKGKYLVKQPCPGYFMLFVNNSDTAIYINEKTKLLQYSRLPFFPLKNEFTWRSELFAINDSTFYLSGKFAGVFKLYSNNRTGSLRIDTTRYFTSYNCNSFLIDNKYKLWMGSNTGLFMEKKSLADLRFGKIPDSVTKANPVLAVKQITVDEQYIYAASTISRGLHIFRKADMAFLKTVYFKFPPYGNKSLFAIARIGKDTILCGTDTGLFWYNSKNGKTGFIDLPDWQVNTNFIVNFFEDHNRVLWIASNIGGGCYLYKNGKYEWFPFQQSLVKNFQEIDRMEEDSRGNIWIGGNGLARYNAEKKIFDLFVDSFPSLRFNRKEVSALAVDKDDNIWLGNTANGLILFEPNKNRFTSFTHAEGLPDNNIEALKITNNILWIACKTGIARMDVKSRKIFSLFNHRELLFNTISSNTFFFDSASQTIYAGVGSDIIRFSAAKQNYNIDPPDILVENIVLGNDSIIWNPPGIIHTSWRNKNIVVTFNAINYHDAQDQRYAYRIVNDKDLRWTALEEQGKIVFTNLTSGRHTIEIKVFSLNNRWEPVTKTFSIIINPPFWRTWWFYLLCIFALASLLYALFRYRINQLKKVIIVREKISQDLHDEVGATLSGISMYSHLTREQIKANQTTEVKKSLDIIQQSAGDMVNRLNDIVWVVNPQQDSLKKLIEKLEEYAYQMAAVKNMNVLVNIPDKIVGLKMSMEGRKNIYLLCKEAINNAMKYSGASVFELTLKHTGHSLEFIIRDNGLGFDADAVKKGNGLLSMQKRADAMKAKYTLLSSPGQGTMITVTCKIT